MRKILKYLLMLLSVFFSAGNIINAQSVGIGDKEFTPNAAAILEIQSTNKGVLIPRMTYVQRMYIPHNANSVGLLVYQTDKDNGFYYWDGLKWVFLAPPTVVELPNFATVATTGNYNDLIGKPTIPSSLSQLESNEYYSTISKTERDKWNAISAGITFTGSYNDLTDKPKIPTQLKELEQDDNYYTTVSRAEREKWNDAATRISFSGSYTDLTNKPDLAKVATGGNYDDLYGKPIIPSALSQLTQDENYYTTVNREERERWNKKSDFSGYYNDLQGKPAIPEMLRDLADDYNHLTVTEQEKDRWNRTASGIMFDGDYYSLTSRPTIPALLSELQQNEYYRTVNDNQIAAWNSKTNFSGYYDDLQGKPILPTMLRDLQSDYNNLTVTELEKQYWNNKSNFSGNHEDLQGKPFVPTKLSDLQQDGYYRTVADAEKLLWNNKSNFSGSYNDLSDRPNISTAANTGNYNDLVNKPYIPTKLSDLDEDMNHRVVTDAQVDKLNTAYNHSQSAHFSGKYTDLSNTPYIPTKLSDLNDDANHRIVTDNQITAWSAKSNFSGSYNDLNNKPDLMSTQNVKDIINAFLPKGTIIMWNGTDNYDHTYWSPYTVMNGRFPVGAYQNGVSNGLSVYDVNATGGEERHTLIIAEMPSHTHAVTGTSGHKRMGGESSFVGAENDNTRTSSATGGDQSHENRPPFYAIFYLVKIK